jgi:hypothetical protein
MLESGTVNSDGGQAAAAFLVICYWLFVISESDPSAVRILITNNK